MDQAILNQIIKSLQDTKIDLINPNPECLNTVLGLSGANLNRLTDEELSQHVYTLSQYVIYLQCQYNVRYIRYLEAKRIYEGSLAEVSSKMTGKTVKEKTMAALLESPKLQELEKRMSGLEYDYLLFEKIPDQVQELSNALKKELSVRSSINYRK